MALQPEQAAGTDLAISSAFDDITDAVRTPEGVEFTKDGQRYLLTQHEGSLGIIPLGNAAPALLDGTAVSQMIQAVLAIDTTLSAAADQARTLARSEIDGHYQGLIFGGLRAGLAKMDYDETVYRPAAKEGRAQTSAQLMTIRSQLNQTVTAHLEHLRAEAESQLRMAREVTEAGHQDELANIAFAGQHARQEKAATAEERRTQRLARSDHQRAQSATKLVQRHELNRIESEALNQVKVIEAQSAAAQALEELKKDIEELRLGQEKEQKQQDRQFDLVKRTLDLGKLIPQWQRQVEVLRATTPEEVAQAAAKAYLAFTDAFIPWSTAATPEEQLVAAPHIQTLAADVTDKILAGMARQAGANGQSK